MKRVIALAVVVLATVGMANAQFINKKAQSVATLLHSSDQVTVWGPGNAQYGDPKLIWDQPASVLRLPAVTGDPISHGLTIWDWDLGFDAGNGPGIVVTAVGAGGILITAQHEAGVVALVQLNAGQGWQLSTSGNWAPINDNSVSLGDPQHRVAGIYVNVPTADPHVAGALWQDPVTHVLMVSQ